MADLTREEIERIRDVASRFIEPADAGATMRALCTMALRAIDTGWRSMESAPRDGTRILVVRDYGNDLFTDTAKLHPSDVIPHLTAWMPLPHPFTGDPATLSGDCNGTGKRGEHG